MARIRTIKPEFWTNEQVADCSPTARLLFVGMWSFCDDCGNHPASFKTLKMEIFPGDSFSINEISAMVFELISNKLIFEYDAENKRYWHVTGWHHQKIEKPNQKYPPPEQGVILQPVADQSPKALQPVADQTPEDVDVDVSSLEGKGSNAVVVLEEATTPKGPTAAEKALIECFSQNKTRLLELYPNADYEAERETCIAHYRSGHPPLDPYPVILKWFNRIPKNRPGLAVVKQPVSDEAETYPYPSPERAEQLRRHLAKQKAAEEAAQNAA